MNLNTISFALVAKANKGKKENKGNNERSCEEEELLSPICELFFVLLCCHLESVSAPQGLLERGAAAAAACLFVCLLASFSRESHRTMTELFVF